MGVGAIIGGVASVAGGLIQSRSADKAADAQADSAAQAVALQREVFDITRGDFAPYRDLGQRGANALAFELGLIETPGGDFNVFSQMAPDGQTYYGIEGDTLQDGSQRWSGNQDYANRRATWLGSQATQGYGGFRETPGYAFRVGEGQKAIERSAAARGGLNSGATMKALANFGQNIAASEYDNYLARLGGFASSGQAAAGQSAAAGNAFANNSGNALMAGGAARASGYLGKSNALTGMLENLAGFGGRAFG